MLYRMIMMISCLMICTFACAGISFAEVGPVRTVVVEGNFLVSPCSRHQAEPCPSIALYPHARIDVYRLGGERVATVDTEKDLVSSLDQRFTLRLAPDLYLFAIENRTNGHTAVFGPVYLAETIKQYQVFFELYNSLPVVKSAGEAARGVRGLWGQREICFQEKIASFLDPDVAPPIVVNPPLVCNLLLQAGARAVESPEPYDEEGTLVTGL